MKPQNQTEVAADHALDVFAAEVEVLGGEVEQSILLAHVKGVEPSGVVASQGPDSPGDLFEFLLHATVGIGQSLGVKVSVIGGPIGQG
jgi:hypothetical protein